MTDETVEQLASVGDSVQDSSAPEGAVPDGAVPNGAVPDEAVPSSPMPNTAIPNTAVPIKAPTGALRHSPPPNPADRVPDDEAPNAALLGRTRLSQNTVNTRPRGAATADRPSLIEPRTEADKLAQATDTETEPATSWRDELASIGGRSPLLHFADTPSTRIELSVTHPGGLAQFITGKTTPLSSLIRDDLALRAAKSAAGLIAAKGLELSTARGIDSIHLGIGIAEWTNDGVEYRAPVLLRPLAIRRHGRDFEVKLRGDAFLNPEFGRAMKEQFQITLDAEAFVRLTDDDGAFKPNPVIDRLRGLTSHLEWFNVQPRLVVSSFADVASGLTADAANCEHPVLDALAGNSTAKWSVKEGHSEIEALGADMREPSTDVLLLDADSEQEQVVAEIAAGNSVVVKTLPGTGGTQTIVNALGALIGQNKRVLVVSPRRATLRGIAQRFGDVGLPGLAVAPRTLRRDIIRSISRNEKAKAAELAEVDDALVRLRTVLLDYRQALAKPDAVLSISVLDCVTELSRLALLPTPPSTTARLSRASVERLAHDRHRVADTMVQAASLGEFRYGPGDSPWYGAQFANGEEAGRAHALAKQLKAETLPRLLVRAGELIGSTRLRPFESVHELGIYLRLLTDLRDTLDKFLPVVFDRSISELIAATAPRREAPEMSSGNRRRLKKLAKEYVRPGVHVNDLHDALSRIQQQRILWQRFVASGVTPEVPVGIADVQVAYQEVTQDLSLLDGPLGYVSREQQLAFLPIDTLTQRITALAAESDVLNNLQERTALMTTLRDLELDPLINDLAMRHLPDSQVGAELELAWWQSALESLLEADRALLGANTPVLDRLEADFRLVDEAHAAGSAQLLGWQVAENWKLGIADWPDEASQLRKTLRRGDLTAFDLQTSAPHLSRAVAPVWLASPYEVHEIADTMPFDTVVIVDAGATTIAENVGAIRRARQVVAFGDPVTQTPTPFTIAIDEPETDVATSAPRPIDDRHDDSALAKLSELLPTLSLTRSYRAGGEDLAELVNRRFYGGRIQSLPWAGSFLGHGSLTLDYIEDGTGMPNPDDGSVESVDAEVQRVVELVLAHAATRPQESLMVLTASAKHAVRVQHAVLTAVAARPDISEIIIGDRPEPFAVLTLEQAVAQSRDRVIFSIGYGRTPHGRVLSDFGALGEPGGERLLAVGMTRARRHLKIVTCFRAEDIEEGRMNHGAVALAEILTEISARAAEDPLPDDSDPMLVDLARRLEKRGLVVALGHRNKLGLVAAHGGACIAIDTDAVLQRTSLRESLRLRPEMLRRLGWHYLRVHSFELFSDPDAVADKVCAIIGAPTGPITEPIGVVGA
ncbi:AAA family ATPase [Salinibacterium sp. ZJ450]|uniref:AAA family ATPase n=1 Tax=Salinibacterium sp. ZJ450 TaxID=2708338 RepID=UPI00174824A7|nr:AAA family ATPase [Salinibacterium sp. ZJ450]